MTGQGVTTELTERLRHAATYIDEHGWTQATERDADDGRVCLTGAVRLCDPQPGDAWLIRQVLRRRGRAEAWNDQPGLSAGEVVGYLQDADITDGDLAATFGPDWQRVVDAARASGRAGWNAMYGAYLSGAYLSGAYLYGAFLDGWERGPTGYACRATTAT